MEDVRRTGFGMAEADYEGRDPLDVVEIVEPTLGGAIVAAEIGPLGLHPSLWQVLRFGIVGTLGFCWDTGTVYATRPVLGLLPAIVLGFVVAATMNWLLNRLWTFRDHASHIPILRQWALFMAANSLGFVLNRGTVYTLVLTIPLCHRQPALALAAGSLAGLAANFTLSQRYVFRRRAT